MQRHGFQSGLGSGRCKAEHSSCCLTTATASGQMLRVATSGIMITITSGKVLLGFLTSPARAPRLKKPLYSQSPQLSNSGRSKP